MNAVATAAPPKIKTPVPAIAWFPLAIFALVWLEVAVLAANDLHCPLTAIAARHTGDRAPNFDIFLPECLARWNKHIFGTLFAVAELYLWWHWPAGG